MTGKRKIIKIFDTDYKEGFILVSKTRIKPGENYFSFPEDSRYGLKDKLFRCSGERIYIKCGVFNPENETGPFFEIPVSFFEEINDEE